MRKRLILHIGMHKTGSSSIQHFLSRNRLALAAAGVLYPRSVGPDGRRQPKHNAIFSAISHEIDHGAPHPVLGPSSEVIDAMARRIAVSRAKTAILSAEGFSGENPAFARALSPLRERFNVTVVAFLREPGAWLESFYRQMVMSREVREARGLGEFLAAPSTEAHLDYMRIIGWWADAFGPEALRIVAFHEGGATSPARSFLTAADLPRALARLPFARAWRNKSATDETVLAVLRANAAEKAAPRPESRLSLTNHERRDLAERLERRWKNRLASGDREVGAPPFIFSMLDDMKFHGK